LRWRKDKSGENEYSSSMDKPLFHPELTVTDALEKDVRVSKVFIRNKTACIGCYLARFCKLRDVAATYDLELDAFIEQLCAAVHSNSIQTKKELKNEKLV
jgi:hypothetical protein